MRRYVILFAGLLAVSACGDPLAGVPRISDVDLAADDPAALALPTEAEVAREGFFGTDSAAASTSAGTLAAPVTKPARRGGLLGLLRRALPSDAAQADVDPVPTDVETVVPTDVELPVPTDVETVVDIEPQQQGEALQAQTTLAALPVEPAVAPKRGGFLSRLIPGRSGAGKPRDGVDAQDVPYGTVLPYGTVARVCDARRKPLGRKVESASAKGYKLYDSKPGTAGVRTYYITGFDDDCPRQLSAAHVLLGAPSFYEQLHYGPAGAHLAFGETDKAYEKVKSRVCGARKGTPCGSKMRALERDTFFVNAYERLDDNTRWSEFLVHGGAVVAASLKAN